jgi:hypothetical protein
MGLLDDAIREHLELKRRHGADPDEVSRQEREALGAPVRGEFAKPAGDAPEEAAEPVSGDEPESAAVDEADEADDVPELAEPPEMPGEPESAPGEPAAVAASRRQPEPGDEEDPWLVEDLADPEVDREPEAAAKPEGDDVLEETPDFLQETPEHDRLWFEQKPPRNFDWDK